LENKILINSNFYETRVAYIQKGKLHNYFIESRKDYSIVGNIYKAKVEKVLPGIQSAFLNIGEDRSAFLHVKNMYIQNINKQSNNRVNIDNFKIEDVLKAGDEILVQVVKDSISTKGPRVETLLSIPGRFMVFFPIGNKVGVSKRISSESERNRLKNIVKSYQPKNTAFIIRTVAEGVPKEVLIADMKNIMLQWIDIVKRQKSVSAPYRLLKELSLPLKIVRDHLDNGDEIIVDNEDLYNEIYNFLKVQMPEYKEKISLYSDSEALFVKYNIENQIKRLHHSKVYLKSGGDIIIEQVEALTVVDVNTGRFVGKNLNHEDVILKTNMEAMEAVAEQIRLRDIGGIVIIDFIDMNSNSSKSALIKHGIELTKKDKAKVSILGLTELGLMQITRKRISDSLERKTTMTCHVCHGTGTIKSHESLTSKIYRDIIKRNKDDILGMVVTITTNQHLHDFLLKETKNFDSLKQNYKLKNIKIKVNDSLAIDSFHIDITKK